MEGEIHILIQPEENGVRIQVHDNGRGIDQSAIDELYDPQPPEQENRGRHIGLRNIKERLSYIYSSEEADLIYVRRDAGTTITISIPDL